MSVIQGHNLEGEAYTANPVVVGYKDADGAAKTASGASGLPVNQVGDVELTHTSVSITDSSTTVLAANAARKYALFVNDGSSVIYLMVSNGAVVNQGIRLIPSGGSYEMSANIGNLDKRVVKAVCATTGLLLVTEGV